jgi:hypothetical protein
VAPEDGLKQIEGWKRFILFDGCNKLIYNKRYIYTKTMHISANDSLYYISIIFSPPWSVFMGLI